MSVKQQERAQHIAELKDELGSVTRSMSIPTFRREDVRWLHKRMAKSNPDHPGLTRAAEIIQELLSMGVV